MNQSVSTAAIPARPGFYSDITSTPDLLATSYFPSMDGLRAVSILMVVVFHFLEALEVRGVGMFANLGVQVFFVISGFLITTLLVKEKVKNGDIDLKKFYIRRFLRILPVAYAFLVVVIILGLVLDLHLKWIFIVTAFLFVRNFFLETPGFDRLSTHYWSLAVEEQFYLIFPLILKKNLRLYINFLLVLLGLSLMLDFFSADFLINVKTNDVMRVILLLVTQFQGIAIGSLFSILLFKEKLNITRLNNIYTQIVLIIGVMVLTYFSGPAKNSMNMLRCGFIASFLVMNLSIQANGIFAFLNRKWMKLIGVLSFSIYIWQQPFTLGLKYFQGTSIAHRFQNKTLFDIFLVLFLTCVLAVVSYLSYFYFEKKFLKFKKKYSTQGGADLRELNSQAS